VLLQCRHGQGASALVYIRNRERVGSGWSDVENIATTGLARRCSALLVRGSTAAATPQSLYISGVLLALSAHLLPALLKMMQSFWPVWRETAIRKKGGKALESVELSRAITR
jgi:hypothetical protein